MHGTGVSPRAVAPSEVLEAVNLPLQATPGMALDSPLPIGLAVLAPMIYVSEQISNPQAGVN